MSYSPAGLLPVTHPVSAARRGADYAFDAIGSERTTLEIIDAVRPGGTAVIVGMAPQAARAPINPYLMAVQEKVIKGTMYSSVRPNVDFPWLVDLYLDGRLKVDELVSRTYRLGDQRGLRRDAGRPGRPRGHRL